MAAATAAAGMGKYVDFTVNSAFFYKNKAH